MGDSFKFIFYYIWCIVVVLVGLFMFETNPEYQESIVLLVIGSLLITYPNSIDEKE